MRIGLDIGSTTLKCVVLNAEDSIVFQSYQRHFSHVKQKCVELLTRIRRELPALDQVDLVISGSAGMGLATDLNIPFAQEVYATQLAVKRLVPDADVVIELGGEDAKILFLQGGLEVRMNGSCAGGTGAFIDQMASLLNISVEQLNELAEQQQQIYTIASRCGVFAKSDVQPLLNQGAQKADICASIFYAVVNQTIGGLAQGRRISGKVVYLGGSLTFFSQLRKAFDTTLKTTGLCPENSLYFVALGAAYSAGKHAKVALDEVIGRIEAYLPTHAYAGCRPLFANQAQYREFTQRHQQSSVPTVPFNPAHPQAYLGIDAGSTTVKAVVIDEEENLITSTYLPNSGNPIPLVKEFLSQLYASYPTIQIKASAVTGYGEEIVKNAFAVDCGIVETVAHFTGAKKFMPDVDFIIDIGGQDIKCFKIRNNAIDNIFLNEACSSGCGSFLQTFAGAIGYSVEEFGKLGLFAPNPVDLGSRCTVFMNSSVKQAQKDGASVENIAAGLSVSVVKNALYKVIRTSSGKTLGEHIVVQGGTFHSDSVLRAFEQEIGKNVVRPNIAGLMGAYGAALYAKQQKPEQSTILTASQLEKFTHSVKTANCGLCTNHCLLTVNTFAGGKRFIGGNRCDRPITGSTPREQLNMFEYKRSLLSAYQPQPGSRGRLGLPMVLNLYELLPFWHTFFTALGFEVVTSPPSNRALYLSGQHTIPSDTVCFPAKLAHGHIEALLDMGVDAIFYPCMTYNLNEKMGDNHYNCPVVAYYPEVIRSNVDNVSSIPFLCDYVGLHRPKDFTKKMKQVLEQYFTGISRQEVALAAEKAYAAYDRHMADIQAKGLAMLTAAREQKMPIIVLAGRPYHIDPEINHGIDKLICDFGAAVLTEDSVPFVRQRLPVTVLNQWTYHARLYASANYVKDQLDMNLVQLVSFGCGVDAITTDEVRSIIESAGRIYTQLKIDEITNLGAVKIRLRSLFATMPRKELEQ
ncbi:MAG: acyl-CoA dehydratase activase [Angelakisella sp.]